MSINEVDPLTQHPLNKCTTSVLKLWALIAFFSLRICDSWYQAALCLQINNQTSLRESAQKVTIWVNGPSGWHTPYGDPGKHRRAYSKFAPSQWETSLQSDAVSHWLCANVKSAPHHTMTSWRRKVFRFPGPMWGSPWYPHNRPVMQRFDAYFVVSLKKNCCTNSKVVDDLRRHDAHVASL